MTKRVVGAIGLAVALARAAIGQEAPAARVRLDSLENKVYIVY